MRNLKRVLSLGLASTMLAGMMATGASAATAFPDAADIKNADAVNMLVALDIIKGKDDGSFDPEGIVTRAEMTKMICVALNGGKDPKLTGTCRFPDAAGNWASGYIEYCANIGVVAGDENGNFNPNNTVTGIEAAKMVLIALGYNAADEGYVNNGAWDTNIGSDANAAGLYEDLAHVNLSEGMNRDDAAQMIFNGLNANMVEYDYKLTTVDGNLVSVAIAKNKEGNPTMMEEKFSGFVVEDLYVVDVTYDDDKEEYTIALSDGMNAVDPATFTTDVDYSYLYGHKVEGVFKDGATQNTLYGVYGVSEVMASGTVADIADEEYDYDTDDTRYYSFLAGAVEAADVEDYYTYDAIDMDDDGEVDCFVVYPYTVETVNYAGATSITLSAAGNKKYEDHNIVDGLKKDDEVKVVAAANTVDGKIAVTTMDTVSGKVDAIKDATYRIDGVYYTAADGVAALTLGEEYDLAVVGTYYFSAEKTSDGDDGELLFVAANDEYVSNVSGKGIVAEVYFLDGTKEVVTVANYYADDAAREADTNTIADIGARDDSIADAFYTYTVKNGEYSLTAIAGDNDAGYDAYAEAAAGYVEADGTVNGDYVADDAIVIAEKKDGDIEFFTGAILLDWSADFGTAVKYFADTANGLDTIQIMYLADENAEDFGSASGDATYGYLLTDPIKVKEGDETYASYTMWTADGEIEVLDENETTALKAGDAVEYKDLGDGIIDTKDAKEAGAYAVTGLSSTVVKLSMTAENEKTYKLTDDTIYVYVDAEAGEGVEGGSMAMASEMPGNSYMLNVKVIVNGSDEVEVIFVDVNNDIADGAETNKAPDADAVG